MKGVNKKKKQANFSLQNNSKSCMRGEPKADVTTRSGVRTFWLPTHPVIITRHYLVTHLKAAKGTITRLISGFEYHF